ncbi:hypothetical protein HK102_009128 [Quaeritorhiza haematococci]|nr:hypothetical protein HK102_009128 [Quaeritorhiza haematococci]
MAAVDNLYMGSSLQQVMPPQRVVQQFPQQHQYQTLYDNSALAANNTIANSKKLSIDTSFTKSTAGVQGFQPQSANTYFLQQQQQHAQHHQAHHAHPSQHFHPYQQSQTAAAAAAIAAQNVNAGAAGVPVPSAAAAAAVAAAAVMGPTRRRRSDHLSPFQLNLGPFFRNTTQTHNVYSADRTRA